MHNHARHASRYIMPLPLTGGGIKPGLLGLGFGLEAKFSGLGLETSGLGIEALGLYGFIFNQTKCRIRLELSAVRLRF